VTPALIESAEKGTWPAALWQQLEENGLTLPQIPEAHGGAGGEWGDAQVVLAAAGRFAVPLPVAETMISAWLLSASRLNVPLGPRPGRGFPPMRSCSREPWRARPRWRAVSSSCSRNRSST